MSDFNPGFDILSDPAKMTFEYGSDTFGPEVEVRTLDAIRPSLMDPKCSGPSKVYAIAMDVGKSEHREKLTTQHLLFGAVTYAAGSLGKEPIRSQGHVHKRSSFANMWSTPEVYEIWSGEAIIYMQEYAQRLPGRCYAVKAGVGDVVIVPPSWAHATISASPIEPLTFGAWCDREYGFEYDDVRRLGGLAFFPMLDDDKGIRWKKNPSYRDQKLIEKSPASYSQFKLDKDVPIYRQYEKDPDRFEFVPRPDRFECLWTDFIP